MDKFTKVFIAIVLTLVILFTSFITYAVVSSIQYQEWLDSLTPEERQEYEMQKEKERQSRIHRYEVVGVTKYAEVSSRNMHRTKTTICYSFSYIQGDTLKHVDGFEHCEYGLYKVIIGDKDQYIIDTNGETTYYLQLTKETLSKIGG